MRVILELAIVLIATKLAGDLSVRFKQPAVLGELIVGMIIGPALLGWVPDSEFFRILSQIGVILLMFIAGLETDVEGLLDNAKSSTSVAVGGIIFPMVFGYLAGVMMGMDQHHAVFLGLTLSATSVSISVQTLKELGKLQTRESMTILGAAVLDDILVIVLLAVVMSFIGGSDVNAMLVIGQKVLFFGTIILVAWKGVPLAMRWLGSLKVSEPVISGAVVLCFIFSYYADMLGVAGIIGAFIAGIAIAQTDYKEKVGRKAGPIAYGVFVPVFFTSIGLRVTFSGLGDQIGFIIIISLIAIFTKMVGAGLGAWLTGFKPFSALRIGSGMISRGEVALILATLGLDNGLLAQQYFAPLIIVVIITTLVTPPILKILFGGDKGEARHAG
ncbi:cation:proton antiporter [Sporolactobacillus sp. THM7-7]|nr:cation:proton antiporter [Sporolactobacillus sp. THM7-7]